MSLAPVARARLHSTLGAVAGFLLWSLTRSPLAIGIVALTTGFALLAWLSPRHYAPVQHRLDLATRALLAAISWLALGLVYFGLFTPLRLWRTLTRQDPLQLRRDPAATTYLRRLPSPPPRFDRQF